MPCVRLLSIGLSRTGSLVPLNATSHRSQALCFFVKHVNFLVEPRHLRFWRIGAAQLIDRLADREFGYFSHIKFSAGEVQDEKGRANAALLLV